jgi:hypothetical protein
MALTPAALSKRHGEKKSIQTLSASPICKSAERWRDDGVPYVHNQFAETRKMVIPHAASVA